MWVLKCDLLLHKMSKAIDLLYNSVKERLSVTYEQFADAMKSWELVELMQKDELVGVVMIKDNELHVGYKSVPKASIKKHINETLARLIKKFGFAVTTVQKTNERGLKFCKRLGFTVTDEKEGKIYMKCDRSKYVS